MDGVWDLNQAAARLPTPSFLTLGLFSLLPHDQTRPPLHPEFSGRRYGDSLSEHFRLMPQVGFNSRSPFFHIARVVGGPRKSRLLGREGLLLHIRIGFLYAPFFFLFVLDLSLSIPDLVLHLLSNVAAPPSPSSTLCPLWRTKL